MKKVLTLLTILVVMLSLVACGPKKQEEAASTETKTTDKKVVKVGVAIYQFNDNFMTLYREELESYFKSKSNDQVTYEVTIADGKNDQAEQSAQIDNFIASGVDLLVLNLVQTSGAATIMDKIIAAKIPTLFINREPSEADLKLSVGTELEGKVAYIGADARQSGKYQGEIIADLPNKGDLNGDGKLSYVMVVGDPENVDAQYRTEFSISQYKEKAGLEVEKLDEQRGDWDQVRGQEIVANALTQHGDKIEVVFCNNDGMALGALEAIKAAGRTVGENIYLVGVDAIPEAKANVEAGTFTGTVLNDHIGQSHKVVEEALKLLNGEKVELYSWVDYVKVVK